VGAAVGAIGPATTDMGSVWRGAAVCFAANGLTYAALIAGLAMMRFPRGAGPRKTAAARGNRPAPAPRHPLGGFYYVWNHTTIRVTMILLMAATILGWSFRTLLPAFTEETFGRGGGAYGVMLSVFGLGALVGALAMAYLGRYRRRRRLILIGIAVFIGSIGVFTVSRSYWLALAALCAAGLGMLMCMAGINSYVQLQVNERFRGRVMGIYGMLFGGMMPAGALLVGWMADRIGSARAVQINLLVLTLVAVAVAAGWRRVARRA
jgi:MFS family permease